jgi:UDP-N-acetylglucosamine transferase subunit ALG13
MIFLTVGTQFPFDRLVRAVDEAAGRNGFDEQIFAQVGTGSYRPKNFEAVPSLAKEIFDERLYEADSIISHAGIGTITMALEHNKPLLVMPRLARYDDVVNDHQLALAEKFEQLGHLSCCWRVARRRWRKSSRSLSLLCPQRGRPNLRPRPGVSQTF